MPAPFHFFKKNCLFKIFKILTHFLKFFRISPSGGGNQNLLPPFEKSGVPNYVINIKFITLLQNSDPLSDDTAFGIPLLQNKLTSAAATEVACLSGKGYASVHLENRSVIVKIMLFPLGVIGKRPTKSIPSISQVLLVYKEIERIKLIFVLLIAVI